MTNGVDYALLHGGGQGGWVWAQTIEALGRQTGGGAGRALALDAPGCGAKRGRSHEDLDNRAIAAELIADIEAAGMSDVVLVGHSHAGVVLPLMLELAPRLFRRVVYVTCIVPPDGMTGVELFGATLRSEAPPDRMGWPADPAGPDRRGFFRAMFCNDMDAGEAERFLDKLGSDDWPHGSMAQNRWRFDHLGAVPATYVVCLQDQALPPAWQVEFAERVRAERIVRIDSGHQVMNTRPHALAEVLLSEGAR